MTPIIIISIFILLSAFFSSIEIAFSSMNHIKVKHMIQNGRSKAKKTLHLAENFDHILITILVGNNVVNIAGASYATIIFIRIWGDIGATISTAVMTVLVLVFGEITPKSIAKKMPEEFAIKMTSILVFFMVILKPFTLIFGLWQKLMSKIFKFEPSKSITEEELLTYVDEVQQEGGINENEGELIRSVIDFDDLKVEDIFTPRVKVISINKNERNRRIINLFRTSGFSRLPVYADSIDDVIGIINYKDYYNKVLLEQNSLESIIKPAVFVTEYMKVSHLLELLQKNKSHMAIVKDEFGGTLGVVTMEDVLEELVGEIWDEHDEVLEHIRKINEHQYIVRGDTDIEDFFDEVDLELDEDADYITVNGWVQEILKTIPNVGDTFIYKNLQTEIKVADEKRVIEILVTVIDLIDVEDV
jgi:putative hemolysin